MTELDFTPALGRAELNSSYDRAIRFWTRERVWRLALRDQVAPKTGEAIIDVGCGTGTFAIMLKRSAPGATVVGLDPDPAILEIAGAKAAAAGAEIEWRVGFARNAAKYPEAFDKAVSSLVFHQVPMAEKRAGLSAMMVAVRPGGEVHIADYARQDRWLMRRLFGIVQRLDGYENTQLNADGALERLLAEIVSGAGEALRVIRTPTGAISLFRAVKPLSNGNPSHVDR